MKRVYSVLIAEDESEIRRALAAMVEEHPVLPGRGLRRRRQSRTAHD